MESITAKRHVLLRHLRRLGLSEEDAQDAAQDVLLRFGDQEAADALVRTLARYAALTIRRQRQRQARLTAAIAPDRGYEPVDPVQARQVLACIDRVLEAMPASDAQLARAMFVGGGDAAVLADLRAGGREMSVAALRMRRSRIRRCLAQRIGMLLY